jgi:hypothetical protein
LARDGKFIQLCITNISRTQNEGIIQNKNLLKFLKIPCFWSLCSLWVASFNDVLPCPSSRRGQMWSKTATVRLACRTVMRDEMKNVYMIFCSLLCKSDQNNLHASCSIVVKKRIFLEFFFSHIGFQYIKCWIEDGSDLNITGWMHDGQRINMLTSSAAPFTVQSTAKCTVSMKTNLFAKMWYIYFRK